LRHNFVVFTDGQKALQVLPPLIDFIPEARLNLAIYHLKNGEVEDAAEILENIEPTTRDEFILKATSNVGLSQSCNIMVGRSTGLLKEAQSYFETVGSSPSEADTIPGRMCMAQYFFLLEQFDDVNIYLGSIQSYLCTCSRVFV